MILANKDVDSIVYSANRRRSKTFVKKKGSMELQSTWILI